MAARTSSVSSRACDSVRTSRSNSGFGLYETKLIETVFTLQLSYMRFPIQVFTANHVLE